MESSKFQLVTKAGHKTYVATKPNYITPNIKIMVYKDCTRTRGVL